MAAINTIIEAVTQAAVEIRSGLSDRRKEDHTENPSGERQLAADVYADNVLSEYLLSIDEVGGYASEEREGITKVDSGDWYVAADPIDGSSNLRSNNMIGTIIAVYDAPLPASGENIVAAAYVLYGPVTTLMIAHNGTVTKKLVRDSECETLQDDLHLPTDPSVYGFGGNVSDWSEEFTKYAREIESNPALKLRYGGSTISDVNQVITYGGIFSYPALKSAPNGKLRLQYEGNPMAYIVESAGGRSSDGEQSLLEVDPIGIHQRVPVHLGNAELIDQLETTLRF